MVNPSESNLAVQAAVKNTATNAVFFFTIPVALDALMVPGIVMEVQALAAAWKSIDESQEVSQVVNGTKLLVVAIPYVYNLLFEICRFTNSRC